MADDIEKREEQLRARLEKLRSLEEEIKKKEKAVKDKEKAKKQMVLRLSPSLWNEIAAWAEEDFRSINGQVEYLRANVSETEKNPITPSKIPSVKTHLLNTGRSGAD